LSLTESDIIRKLLERVDAGDFEDIQVIYTAAGGAPGSGLEEEITLSGNGQVKLKRKDEIKQVSIQEAFLTVDPVEIQSIFRQIGLGSENDTGSELGFVPDSLVGSIRVIVGNYGFIRIFLARELDQLLQKKPVAPQINEAVRNIQRITLQLGDNQ
jgi:hypothetical protein